MKGFKLRRVLAILWMAVLLQLPGLMTFSQAQEDPESSAYFNFEPFITNFEGDPPGLIKVDASLRIDAGLETVIARHLPYIRHEVIMLLNRQHDETLATVDGREQIRQQALTLIRQIIRDEAGLDGVNELLFTAFLTQKN